MRSKIKNISLTALTLMLLTISMPFQADESLGDDKFFRRRLVDPKQKSGGKLARMTPIPFTSRPSTVIAMVNEHTLTYGELYDKYASAIDNNPKLRKMLSGEFRIYVKNQNMKRLIMEWRDYTLMIDAARLNGFNATDIEVMEAINALAELSMLKDDIDTLCKRRKISKKELIEQFRESLIIEKFVNSILQEGVRESELKKQYKNNPQAFRKPESLYALMLFKTKFDQSAMALNEGNEVAAIKPKLKSDLDLDKLKLKMEGFRLKAASADAFLELARKHSDRPFAGNECIVGWVEPMFNVSNKKLKKSERKAMWDVMKRSTVSRQLNQLYFEQEAGVVSKVLETQVGYHLIFIVEKRPAVEPNFETAKMIMLNSYYDEYHGRIIGTLIKTQQIIVKYRGLRTAEVQANKNRALEAKKKFLESKK